MVSDLKHGETVKASLRLNFCCDGQHHNISVSDDDVTMRWDGISLELTVDFGYGSLHVADNVYWEMQRIVPLLRKDRF